MVIMILGVTPPHRLKNNEGRNGKKQNKKCSKLPELPKNLVEKDFQILLSPIMKKIKDILRFVSNPRQEIPLYLDDRN